MSRPAVALLVAVALAAPAVHAQTPDPPRAFLLFIDDLHLDFRQTPRTRALMQRLLRDVARDTDVWSVVTTGTSSVNVSPTTDVTAINAAVSRVTGNGLKPSERVPATPGSSALELQRRASVSFATATRAIETIAAAAPRASLTVLYVSDGYDASVVPAMSPVVRATIAARALLVVVSPLDFVPGREGPVDVPPDAWAAYVEATRQSLRTLAEQTGGIAVFSREQLNAALAGRVQAPAPRAYLVVVDDVHLDFRSTPRTRKLLQDLSNSGRENDTWSLITTGSPGLRMEPTKGSASLRAWVNRVAGNALALREQLNAFGDPERTAIVRRRASITDIVIAQAIERVAELATGPLTIVYLTDGYDARMVPAMSEVVRATSEARASLVAISVPGQFAEREPPADVRPEEWTAFAEAARASIQTLAEQTGGIAVFSREELDAAFARFSQP